MGHTNWPPFKHEIKEPRTGKKCREQRNFNRKIESIRHNSIFFFFFNKFSSGAPPPLGFIQLVNYRNLCN